MQTRWNLTQTKFPCEMGNQYIINRINDIFNVSFIVSTCFNMFQHVSTCLICCHLGWEQGGSPYLPYLIRCEAGGTPAPVGGIELVPLAFIRLAEKDGGSWLISRGYHGPAKAFSFLDVSDLGYRKFETSWVRPPFVRWTFALLMWATTGSVWSHTTARRKQPFLRAARYAEGIIYYWELPYI